MVGGGLAFTSLKVTDFGIAKMAEHEVNRAASGGTEATAASKTVMNALAYIAPEVIASWKTASRPADVWAIAAIAWELLNGAPPFGAGLKAIVKIVGGDKPELRPSIAEHVQFGGLARELADVFKECFEKEPGKRPTANDLMARCDTICYMPPVGREVGAIKNYPKSTYGFIETPAGTGVFFHTRSIVGGGRPTPGTRVWFSKFEGQPAPRAFPVVPMKG